jgi:hypothetical protein
MSNDRRALRRDQPVALDDQDPGNTDIDNLVAPLDPDDDVFTLLNPDQGHSEPFPAQQDNPR